MNAREQILSIPESLRVLGFSVTTVIALKCGVFVVVSFLLIQAGACGKVIHHNQDQAAQTAVSFAKLAIIDENYVTAFSHLDPGVRQNLTVEKLQALTTEMHPEGRPASIIASEYEPMPGKEAMKIFLTGKNDAEDFLYVFLMKGSTGTGYRVSSVARLRSVPQPSQLRKPLNNPNQN